MKAQEFIAKWGPGGPAFELNERQGAQPHFIDLCQLLGVTLPGSMHDGGDYIFEQDTLVLGEARGYADVFYRNHFAWENKAPGRNLDTALKQLLTYSLALANPPLLVVCDRLTTRIHTQFNGHPSEVHTVLLAELDQPEKQALLRRLWTDPESFRPKKTSRDITEAAARSFATLADGLRKRDHDADDVAHFLTQCLFCFFAEDVGLLPGRMFEGLVNNRNLTADKLTQGLTNLFTVMRDGGLYGNDDIPWFNGGLFKKVAVPLLSIMEVTELRNAAALNWSAIDVSIFGTLFERGLDPSKRSQLGAHYTDPATILRLVEPVIQRPLLQIWEHEKTILYGLLAKSSRKGDKNHRAARDRFILWLERLKDYRVLDPACGSGNFLFLGLKALKDIEHRSHLDAAALGLDRQADLVTGPHNVLGIELNEYAAELARVTVWIGELQWRLAHGYDFKTNPVLEPLDHIECRDALLSFAVLEAPVDGSGARPAQTPGAHTLRFLKSPPTSAPPTPLRETVEQETGSDPDFAQRNSGSDPVSCGASEKETRVTEAPWPPASVVVGNPPFLGDKKMRAELGDAYTTTLRKVYEGRVPGGADLVCYWFEKARAAIKSNGLGAAGLVATNSIRGGKNRVVLDAIAKTTRIFEAWSDEGWVNEGAAVRVSLVAFGNEKQAAVLDGKTVGGIYSDLTTSGAGSQNVDLTAAARLQSNSATAFQGSVKVGSFDIEGEAARSWLRAPNVNGKSNAEVLRPLRNARDLTTKPRDAWIVDFGKIPLVDAQLYELPFDHVQRFVKPFRDQNRDVSRRMNWWLHGRTGDDLRAAVAPITRVIVTPRVAKYRLFVYVATRVYVDDATALIARADDTTFGILHSRFHELWSLRMGTSLEDRPRYTPTTCFETFPFPAGLTPADTAHQRTETLEGGAVIPEIRGQSPISPETLRANAEQDAAKSGSDPKFPAAATVKKATSESNDKFTAAVTSKEINSASTGTKARMGRMSGAISKSEAYEPPASALSAPAGETGTGSSPPAGEAGADRAAAVRIALAAHRLNALREAWLNPPEWTDRVPEVIPLGMAASPYPDRILPRPGHEKELAERTLTKLYNQRPAWLDAAHRALDAAVAQAYGWSDYTADMPDEEILKRLLALNLQRSAPSA